jgi:hypothetical protein
MTAAFADTSFYVASLSPRDALHGRAEAVGRGFRGRVVTTEYVLLEVATFFSAPPNRPVFLALLDALRRDPDVDVVRASADLWDRGVARFAARPDKAWSLTDCVSFIVMEDRGLADALTADHHFEQAGFVALLR